MPQTISVSDATVVEVISAYAATNQQLDAATAAPAWNVIGAFYMPMSASVQLEAIGLVSDAGNEMLVRLFDVVGAAPVSGSTTAVIDGLVDERALSGAFTLPGGKVYQVQAQCIGAAGFGIVRSAQPVSA